MSTINHGCSPSFTHASESRTTYCCPHGPHPHSPPLPVKAGWRGVKPSLDALIHVAAAGSAIKAGASQRPMRIVRLAALIAREVATGEQSPPGYSFGRGSRGSPSGGDASASICSQRTDLRNLYQCRVRLGCWRATEEFRMSDPDRLTTRDDTSSRQAGSYPSRSCGCFSCRAILAYGRRCRAAMTR